MRPAPARVGPTFILVCIAFLANLPALAAGFLWDDNLWLSDSPITIAADGWWRIWTHGAHFDWYPLTSDAFWAMWRVFGGAPFGYHLVNLVLHAVGAVILFRVLQALALPGAWLGAALWAVHPVNVATVAWIAELKNTLSFPLYAGAALLWVRRQDSGSARTRAGAMVLHGASLLAKASGVGLPVALAVLAWARGRAIRREIRDLVPMFLLSIASAFVTWRFQVEGAIGSAATSTMDLPARVAGAARAVWFYAGKALVPTDLAIIYPGTSPPGGLLAWLPLLALGVALVGLFALRRRVGRGQFAVAAGYVILLAPVLGLVRTYYFRWSPFADHWQYHALPWLLAGVAAVVARAADALRIPAWPQRAVAAAWVAGFSVLSFAQARAYHDPRTFWERVLVYDAGSSLAHAELGVQLAREGDAPAAERHLRIAVAADTTDGLAPNNLGRVLEGTGRLEEAVDAYRLARARAPRLVSAQANLGRALAQAGRTEEAVAELRAAAAADPRFAEPRFNLARIYVAGGEDDSARVQLDDVLRIDPGAVDARRMLAQLFVRRGDLAAAAEQMREVARLRPDDAEARQVLEALDRAMGGARAAP